eukprot:CAMPEP_0171986456 /NCGR_PEP_ID=MMETSP0993-20121228/274881_1 /TAXON_ID=483369 /ORGANISM="non described non described, Strain CCMP2098" /LENGTH=521 /DNA_ID=CAMNT_0012639363 /DNA_START=155 /DNA_END=1721 /DNA_ORIENTATION=+
MTWGVQNNEADAHAQLDLALSAGVNFIDTAEMYAVPPSRATYGVTERYLGSWLAADSSRRAKVVLATKVSGTGLDYAPHLRRRDLLADLAKDVSADELEKRFGPVPAKALLSRAQIHESLEASLLRLQTTYVDLYQLHWPARYTPMFGFKAYERRMERTSQAVPSIDEQVAAMGELMKAGKIRAWGLSNENGVGVTLFLESARRLGVPAPATIQNDFSLVQRKFETDGTAEACSPFTSGTSHGVSLLAYGALAGGTLTGKITADGVAPPDSRHVMFPHFQPRYYSEGSRASAQEYAALARELNSEREKRGGGSVSGGSKSSSGERSDDDDGSGVASVDGSSSEFTPAKLALLWARASRQPARWFPHFQPRYYSEGSRASAQEYAALARELNSEREKRGGGSVSGGSKSSSGERSDDDDGSGVASVDGSSSEFTPAKLALLWARRREYVGAVIVGATSLAQLRENLEAFNGDDDDLLDSGILAQIDSIEEQSASAYYRGVKPGSLVAGSSVLGTKPTAKLEL